MLLHCVSSYPAKAEDSNLRTIPDMAAAFDVLVGLSDHTLGHRGRGSRDRARRLRDRKACDDASRRRRAGTAFSLEPDEFARLVAETAIAHEALGRVSYAPEASEGAMRKLRRSLYVVADMTEGEVFSVAKSSSYTAGAGPCATAPAGDTWNAGRDGN